MIKKLFKVLSLMLLITVVLGMSAGCQQQAKSPTAAPAKVYNILVVIKSQDSEFWQIVNNGAKAAAAELGSKANVTFNAVVSSNDFEGQVALFHDAITSHPDAIVISPESQGTAAVFQQAVDAGIKLVLMDENFDFTNYTSFIRSDNVAIGQAAAQAMVDALKAAGKELKGSVGIISPVPGIPLLNDRDSGFTNKLKELAPDITMLATRYCNGDMTQAVAATEDIYAANKDTLVGLYGDANFGGDAIAQGIIEGNLQGKFIVTATDNDPAEIQAINDGTIKAIIVQDAYNFGYQGVMDAYNALTGQPVQKDVLMPVKTVTLANLNDPDIQRILSAGTTK